jgi:hypothetical protein
MRTLVALLLLVLTRDGNVHRFDGHSDTTAKAPQASAIAVVANRTVVLAGGKLTVDGKPVPGRFDDVRALAGGEQLWALTPDSVLSIDTRTGKRAKLLEMPRLHRLAVDGHDAFAEHDGVINHVGAGEGWNVHGQPVALAAGDGKLWVAMKSGPLVEIDRASGKQRVLPLGDWWGTIALAYGDHALYAVTVAGKLWRIDPQKDQKTIVAMDGWQGAIDLAVLR